ncbi:hypothetical protein V2J09_019911 [Rumex salicifolius]
MWTTLRHEVLFISQLPSASTLLRSLSLRQPPWISTSLINLFHRSFSLTPDSDGKMEILKLEEVEAVLKKVKADDIRIIPVGNICSWTDYMVLATGRSTWHVKNIAQAILYEAKEKQRGVQRMVLPSVEGQEGGKWIVIDSGTIMIHAFDEKARAYYDLERHWTSVKSPSESSQYLAKAMTKVRPKNNSKKKVQLTA